VSFSRAPHPATPASAVDPAPPGDAALAIDAALTIDAACARELGLGRWRHVRASRRLVVEGALALALGGRDRLELPEESFLGRLAADQAAAMRRFLESDGEAEAREIRLGLVDRAGEPMEVRFVRAGGAAASAAAPDAGVQGHLLVLPQAPGPPPPLVAGRRPRFVAELAARFEAEPRASVLLLAQFDRLSLLEAAHADAGTLDRQVRERLSRLPQAVLTARLENDIIAVLFENGHGLKAGACLKEAAAALKAPFSLGGREHRLTATLGAAAYPRHAGDVESLWNHAEIALDQARWQGRGGQVVFSRRVARGQAERLTLESDLRRALAADELELRYQPIVDLRTRRIAAVETLMRWRHPERGLVPPDTFVPLAESLGLIQPFTDWMIGRAADELGPLLERHPELGVNFNLSARHVRPALIEGMLGHLDRARGLAPERVTFEVTEGTLLENTEPARLALETLKARGCRLALDDFGTGFSSISYLDSFPIDSIKIDKAFVRAFDSTPERRKLLEAMLSMGSALELEIVAEGVEAVEELAFLAAKGCHKVQGYLFAPALAAAGLDELLQGFRFPEGALDEALWPKARGGLPRLLADNQETAFRLFVKHVPIAVAMFDREMRYLAASDRWLKDYRVPEGEEVVGRCHYDVLPETPEAWRRGHARCLAGEIEVDRAERDRYRHRDGSVDWLRWEVRPFRNSFGDVAGLIIFSEFITEKVEAERRRAESEERLADFLEVASDWFSETDADHRFTAISNARTAGGWPVSGDLGLRRWEVPGVVHDPEDPAWRQHKADLEAHRPFRNFVTARRDKEGELVWREVSGKPVFDEAGRFLGYRCVGRDVTERVRAEQRLAHSEARLADFLEVASDWLCETDAEHRLTCISSDRAGAGRPAAGDLGLRRWEIEGVVHDPEDPAWQRHKADLEAHRPFRNFLYARRDTAGAITYRVISGKPVFDEAGRFQGYRCAGRDVTERVLAEQKLTRSEARLGHFLETASDWLWEMDAELRFTSAGEDRHFPGIDARRFIGRTRWEAAGVDPEKDERWRRHKEDLLARRPFRDFEVAYHDDDGRPHYRLISGIPIFDETGAFEGYRGTVRDVTEARKAEQALRKQAEQLELAGEMAKLGHWHYDFVENRYVWSANLYRLIGRDPASFRLDFDNRLEVFHPDDRARMDQALKHAIATRSAFAERVRVVMPDGAIRHFVSRGRPEHDASGRLTGFFGIAQDITEEIEARAELEAQSRDNALYRETIETLPVPVYGKDAQGRFLFANPATAAMMGMADPKELLGRGDPDFWRPELARRYAEEERRVLAAGEVVKSQQPYDRPDGRCGWTSSVKAPIRDEAGRIWALIGNDIDVTELHEAREAALARSRENELYRKIIESTPALVYCKDRDGRFTFANQALLDSLGVASLEALRGRTDHDFQDPASADRFREDEQNVIAEGRTMRFEHHLRLPDGRMTWHASFKIPLTDEAGRVTGLIGINHDISELKEARDTALAASRENALYRQAFESLPDFVFIKDREGRFLAANQATAMVMDAGTPEALLGKTDFDFYPLDLARRYRADEEAMYARGETVMVEQPVWRADGEDGLMIALKVPMRDGTGAIIGHVGHGRDVTREKRAQTALAESEARYRELVDGSLQGLLIIQDGRGVFANETFARLHGYDDVATALADNEARLAWQPEPTRRLFLEMRARLARGEDIDEALRVEVVRKDGGRLWAEDRIRRIEWNGRPALQYTMVDVTRQVEYERALEEDKRRLEQQAAEMNRLVAELERAKAEAEDARDILSETAAVMSDGFALFDDNDRLVTCDDDFARAYERPSAELIGSSFRALQDYPAVRATAERSGHRFEDWLEERLAIHRRADGSPLLLNIHERWFQIREKRTRNGWTVLVRSDVTHLKETEEELRRLATVDTLTETANRWHFTEQGERILARHRQKGEPLALLMFDIDHFKEVNDRSGHAAGDEALRALARVCREVLRAGDLIARWGGEEFLALLPGVAEADARNVAERLRRRIEELEITAEGARFGITVSIGLATTAEVSGSLERLILAADRALYVAKQAGRNRVVVNRDLAPAD